MSRALSFAIWIAVLAFAWAQLWPLVNDWVHWRGSSASQADICLQAATDAYNHSQSSIYRLSRIPVDQARWGSFRLEGDDLIEIGRAQCSCPARTCSSGRDALDALQGTLGNFDTATSNNVAAENGSRQMQHVRSLLDAAREWLGTDPAEKRE